ncbi:hypothetical protein BDW02DRAFT_574547 [Decorospora gaudefroyi]|uniref:DUF7136 domain-containing protein n=1 Tax=Decorospora gaudefroyi TaxID=184978 RepID=A0A6A5JZ03_9PLEO|nr:hypothetical protein BDW02DRAFT_574547 [Decorospora gaudefroyi]
MAGPVNWVLIHGGHAVYRAAALTTNREMVWGTSPESSSSFTSLESSSSFTLPTHLRVSLLPIPIFSKMRLISLSILACLASLLSITTGQGFSNTTYDNPIPISIDLLFPRNATYRPQYRFPIIFAIHNPAAFWPFDFDFQYDLDVFDLAGQRIASPPRGGFEKAQHLQEWNAPNEAYPEDVKVMEEMVLGDKDTLMIFNTTGALNNITGEAHVVMTMLIGFRNNCSTTIPISRTDGMNREDDGFEKGNPAVWFRDRTMRFTIKNSTDTPFPMANIESTCAERIGAFEIEGEVGIPFGQVDEWWGTCPVVKVIENGEQCGMRIGGELEPKVRGHILNKTCSRPERANPEVVWPNPTAVTEMELCKSGGTVLEALKKWVIGVMLLGTFAVL